MWKMNERRMKGTKGALNVPLTRTPAPLLASDVKGRGIVVLLVSHSAGFDYVPRYPDEHRSTYANDTQALARRVAREFPKSGSAIRNG